MRAVLQAGMPEIAVPSNDQLPALGLSKPVSRLNSVVLPAPFGPMSAVMALRGISRCSTSTAVRPPNTRRTPSMTMIGSTLATPGRISPVCNPVVLGRGVGGATSADKGQLLRVPEDALRAEDDQQHEGDTHEHEHEHLALLGGEEG